ncbi:hypothetical protein KCO_10105 [Pectobacterium brasiliense ICMP 19477]|nr:hypothetical protein KCO_10105 [Pectobacterium brasiliense ICMP 19477]
MNSDVVPQPIAASTFAVVIQRSHEYKCFYKQYVVTNSVVTNHVVKNKLSQIK